MTGTCQHCGMIHGAICPRIAAVEYYENGTVKRVEYIQPNAAQTPVVWPQNVPQAPVKTAGGIGLL